MELRSEILLHTAYLPDLRQLAFVFFNQCPYLAKNPKMCIMFKVAQISLLYQDQNCLIKI